MIVVAGEALIDLVLGADGTLEGYPGGGPYNVARTIGRLDAPVAYLGRLSTDRFGRMLRDGLEQDGVSVDMAAATDAPTTLALAELDRSGAASYGFYVEGTSAPGLTPLEATLPQALTTLYVGTLGLVFEPLATTLEALATAAGPDTLVALDPNVRPAAITDAAAYRARLDRILARADVVKASADDLEWIAPGLGPVEAAHRLSAAGPAVVLVTLGSAGALVVSGGASTEVPPYPTDVVDTIGAGDAFIGAFLAWWHRAGLGRDALGAAEPTATAAAFASEVAARTVARRGADPPRLDELKR